jgi:hypothetical protein
MRRSVVLRIYKTWHVTYHHLHGAVNADLHGESSAVGWGRRRGGMLSAAGDSLVTIEGAVEDERLGAQIRVAL